MPDNPPAGVQRVTLRIAYRNPAEAVKFMEAAFGFPELVDKRLEGPNQSIIVTEVQIGDTYIMVGPEGSHDLASPLTTGSSTESLMVYVDDIDAHFLKAKAAGAEIIAAPADQYWGDRRYEAKDLEGHLWFFHERTRNVSRQEIEEIEASFRES